MLCGLDVPIMSSQNAASWGYYNTVKEEWNVEALEKGNFPTRFLPKVGKEGHFAGRCSGILWQVVPKGTPVGPAMGDLQCSFLSTVYRPGYAMLNVSTSAQLAFVMPDGFVPSNVHDGEEVSGCSDSYHVQYFPYFEGKYLAVAAAMTGGNCLSAFVTMLEQWMVVLGCNVSQGN